MNHKEKLEISFLINFLNDNLEKKENEKSDVYTIKHSKHKLDNYIYRICKYFNKISDGSFELSTIFIMALVYIDKYSNMTNRKVNLQNIHLLILTSFLVSNKFIEDEPIENDLMAKIGGISLSVMNKLEYNFLSDIDFELRQDKNFFTLKKKMDDVIKYC